MPTMTHYSHGRKVKQKGGALLVAMVIIFMLALMGVSSMRGSTLERRMASNSIQTANTFQSAESTTEIALNNPDNLSATFQLGEGTALNVPVDLQQEFVIQADATVRYLGLGPAYGYSFGDGSSSTFVGLRFEVDGDAQVDSVRSRARVTQGAYRIVPGI